MTNERSPIIQTLEGDQLTDRDILDARIALRSTRGTCSVYAFPCWQAHTASARVEKAAPWRSVLTTSLANEAL